MGESPKFSILILILCRQYACNFLVLFISEKWRCFLLIIRKKKVVQNCEKLYNDKEKTLCEMKRK